MMHPTFWKFLRDGSVLSQFVSAHVLDVPYLSSKVRFQKTIFRNFRSRLQKSVVEDSSYLFTYPSDVRKWLGSS